MYFEFLSLGSVGGRSESKPTVFALQYSQHIKVVCERLKQYAKILRIC